MMLKTIILYWFQTTLESWLLTPSRFYWIKDQVAAPPVAVEKDDQTLVARFIPEVKTFPSLHFRLPKLKILIKKRFSLNLNFPYFLDRKVSV